MLLARWQKSNLILHMRGRRNRRSLFRSAGPWPARAPWACSRWKDRIWPNLALDWPTPLPPTPASSVGFFEPRRPKMPTFACFFGPRCRPLPIFSLFFRICFSMPFWIDFVSIFDPILAPTWPPKSTKIHEKSMPRCLPKMTSFFDRFLIDFWSQFGPPEPQKSLKFYWFFNVFLIFGVLNIRSILGSIWVPTWLHFCTPNPSKPSPKSIPRAIKILIDFCFDFSPCWLRVGSQLGAMLGTFFEPKHPKMPPERPQDVPGHPQDTQRHPKTAQSAPKTPPRRRKPSPDDDFGRILVRFWKFLGRFWKILEDFWEDFAVQRASSNLLSKKACLHKIAFQKSQSKK